ncbi:MAG: hypothetical protein ACN0LA_10020 [Candidatus Longimicrobiales bacterium M2_2A_002]
MDREEIRRRKRAVVEDRRITIGELKERLRLWDDDDVLDFGSTLSGDPLVFYRVKDRGRPPGGAPAIVQIELNEVTDDWVED